MVSTLRRDAESQYDGGAAEQHPHVRLQSFARSSQSLLGVNTAGSLQKSSLSMQPGAGDGDGDTGDGLGRGPGEGPGAPC